MHIESCVFLRSSLNWSSHVINCFIIYVRRSHLLHYMWTISNPTNSLWISHTFLRSQIAKSKVEQCIIKATTMQWLMDDHNNIYLYKHVIVSFVFFVRRLFKKEEGGVMRFPFWVGYNTPCQLLGSYYVRKTMTWFQRNDQQRHIKTNQHELPFLCLQVLMGSRQSFICWNFAWSSLNVYLKSNPRTKHTCNWIRRKQVEEIRTNAKWCHIIFYVSQVILIHWRFFVLMQRWKAHWCLVQKCRIGITCPCALVKVNDL